LSASPGSRHRSCTRCRGTLPLEFRFQRAKEPFGDLLDLAEAVDLDEQAAFAVEPHEWFGLLGVDLEAAADHRFGVIGAPLLLGTAEQPGDDLLVVRGEFDDGI